MQMNQPWEIMQLTVWDLFPEELAVDCWLNLQLFKTWLPYLARSDFQGWSHFSTPFSTTLCPLFHMICHVWWHFHKSISPTTYTYKKNKNGWSVFSYFRSYLGHITGVSSNYQHVVVQLWFNTDTYSLISLNTKTTNYCTDKKCVCAEQASHLNSYQTIFCFSSLL